MSGEKKPEVKDNSHPFERPKTGPDPDKARKGGEKVVQGTLDNKKQSSYR